MNKKIAIFHWLPRLLCMASILFISSFSLDAPDGGHTLALKMAHLFGHLLPSFVLTAILVVAWRWERIGGAAFVAIGLGLMPYVYHLNHGRNAFTVSQSLIVVLIINVPFILTGFLFLLSNRQKNKHRLTPTS